MLFTLVEPNRGREVDYNRWYEGDHFFATVVGPGVLSARRFACPRRLKDLRVIGDRPIVPNADVGSYLAVYMLEDLNAFSQWGAVNTERLRSEGRIFSEREHIHTLMYSFEWWHNREPDGVTPELALDHPFDLVVVEVVEAGPASSKSNFCDWLANRHGPAVLAETGAELILSFSPVPLLEGAAADVPRASVGDTYLNLHFHRKAEPEQVMADLRKTTEQLEGNHFGRVQFVSPFVPTVPGTDRYVDELW
jgi:hypothetical protein